MCQVGHFGPVFWSKRDASIRLMRLMLLIPARRSPAVRSTRSIAVRSTRSIGIQSSGGGTPIKSIKSIKCVKWAISGPLFGLKGDASIRLMHLMHLMLLIPGAGAPAVRSIRILSIGIQSIGRGSPPSKASNVSNGPFRARFLV